MLSLLAAFAVVAMMSTTPAFAGDSPNEQIFRAVEREVLKYPFFTIFDSVHATVHDGVVELTGKVTMPYKPGGIERRVVKVPGVTQVINRIEVLPVSPFDDSLREAFAKTMADPEFLKEAEKAMAAGIDYSTPRQIEDFLARVYQFPPAVIDRAAKFVGQ